MTHTLPSFLLESAATLLVMGPLTVWLNRWQDKRFRRRWEKEFGEPLPDESVPEVLLVGALLWCAALVLAVFAGRVLNRDPLSMASGGTLSAGLYVTYYGIWRGRAPRRS